MTTLDFRIINNDFLNKISRIIEDNISHDQFGVSELAHEVGMSRSNLLRKVKKLTNLSASQYIRQIRLQHAMELLKQTSLNVSEVSYKVGFSSTSYFIKCFHDYYGYPPGEAGKREDNESDSEQKTSSSHAHQLAAIMFTDIEGYTALMQRDEVTAVNFRNRHREIFNSMIKKFNGRILQYYGDGTLSTFPSAIDAVNCGIEMQLAFREEPKMPVRIGIHSGDIIFTEDDIIGDGVNVASRVESLAVAGSVFISDKVFDEVKNQPGIHTLSMGEFELKNVGKPLEVFAITNRGLEVPEKNQISGKEKNKSNNDLQISGRKKAGILWILITLVAIVFGYLIYEKDIFELRKQSAVADQTISRKSIAVLPFINDSNDSTNVYIVNGLMESILNNLQKIEDLRVVSRTSVEKYRNASKLLPDIAEELNVKFLVEGSGQKIDDQIMLHIQLIEAPSDKHLWGKQYNREAKDIFKLQMEVAKNIADEIQAIITPEEEERMNKIPTENLVAYDYFLKGQEFFRMEDYANLEPAISFFRKAIEHDKEFARAYANIAIAYYYLDIYKTEKVYSDSIKVNSEKALLFDPQSSTSLLSHALFYMNEAAYDQAVPYLEKAILYNPNSAFAINLLADLYATRIPNPEKYLEFALKGIQLDIASHDSITASYTYLHISNSLVQSGFITEAEMYINKSLDYNPMNLFSEYVKAYILYAKNKDLNQTKDLLLAALNKDSTRLDILQEVGKIFYYKRDYDSAYKYYKRFTDIREAQNLEMYRGENSKIAVVLDKIGKSKESEEYFKNYWNYAENDNSVYKNLSLSAYYSYHNETDKAIEHLKLFSQQDNYYYWLIPFLEIDPLMDNIKDLPEFKKIMSDIEGKFWNKHMKTKASLKEKGLI